MLLEGVKIGFALTGSFCTFDKVLPEMEKMTVEGAIVYPVISDSVSRFDTRFGCAEDFKARMKQITGNDVINSIIQAEPIGPKGLLDVMVVAPCTGNTIGKLANAITDTTVTMACKAHLRNLRPLVIAVSTNDGLSTNAKNIGLLLNMKYVFLVPFRQDEPVKKPNSLVAEMDLLIPTVLEALKGNQIQPLLVH